MKHGAGYWHELTPWRTPMDMDIAAAVWMTSRINIFEDSSVMRTVGTEQPMVLRDYRYNQDRAATQRTP